MINICPALSGGAWIPKMKGAVDPNWRQRAVAIGRRRPFGPVHLAERETADHQPGLQIELCRRYPQFRDVHRLEAIIQVSSCRFDLERNGLEVHLTFRSCLDREFF